jgi:acetolactate synthase-1/2/3 large subunit
MTSGGLGTMGYGLPAAIGVQMAHPDALVIDIAGEASILMNMQEMSTRCSTACRSRSSSSTTSTWAWCASGSSCCTATATRELLRGLPDFVKLAEAYGGQVGMRCDNPADSTTRSRR